MNKVRYAIILLGIWVFLIMGYAIYKLEKNIDMLGVKFYKLSEGILDDDTITLQGINMLSPSFVEDYKILLDKTKNNNSNIIDVESIMGKMGIVGSNEHENDKRFFKRDNRLYMYLSDLNFNKGSETLLYKGVAVTLTESFLRDLGIGYKNIGNLSVESDVSINIWGNGIIKIIVEDRDNKIKKEFKVQMKRFEFCGIVGV